MPSTFFDFVEKSPSHMAFIVFEGIDGAGKSTLMSLVEKALAVNSISYRHVRDPGSTAIGEKIRNIILEKSLEVPVAKCEMLLYQAARVQMVDLLIRPALLRGEWVLSDRFYSSTLAFQNSARGIKEEVIQRLNDFVAEDCQPDLFVFVDITIAESRRRVAGRGQAHDRMESEGDHFHENVRQGYQRQAQSNPSRWLVLDGTEQPAVLCTAVLNECKRRKWLV